MPTIHASKSGGRLETVNYNCSCGFAHRRHRIDSNRCRSVSSHRHSDIDDEIITYTGKDGTATANVNGAVQSSTNVAVDGNSGHNYCWYGCHWHRH